MAAFLACHARYGLFHVNQPKAQRLGVQTLSVSSISSSSSEIGTQSVLPMYTGTRRTETFPKRWVQRHSTCLIRPHHACDSLVNAVTTFVDSYAFSCAPYKEACRMTPLRSVIPEAYFSQRPHLALSPEPSAISSCPKPWMLLPAEVPLLVVLPDELRGALHA